ncbi:MAG: hypothetical protein PUP91_39505 [Rhizonema sp. PD37]|nr:hypothetical protein [Rhizonema sp. PD37]
MRERVQKGSKYREVLAVLSITGMSDIQGEMSHKQRLGVISSATKIEVSKSGIRQERRE